MDGFHLLKAAERVTLWNELRDGTLVQRARDQQHDVVDHVAVPTNRHSLQLYNSTNRHSLQLYNSTNRHNLQLYKQTQHSTLQTDTAFNSTNRHSLQLYKQTQPSTLQTDTVFNSTNRHSLQVYKQTHPSTLQTDTTFNSTNRHSFQLYKQTQPSTLQTGTAFNFLQAVNTCMQACMWAIPCQINHFWHFFYTFLERSHKTLSIRPTISELQVINFVIYIFLMR